MNATERHPVVSSGFDLHSYYPSGHHWNLHCQADRIVSVQWRAGDAPAPSQGMGGLENFAGRRVFMGTFHLPGDDVSNPGASRRSFNLAIADRLLGDGFREPKIAFFRERRWNLIDIATDDGWRFSVTYRRAWLRQFLRGYEDPPADIFEWIYYLVFHIRPQWLANERTAPLKEI